MSKALAILGIVGVVLAAAFAFAVSGALVPIIALVFAIVCGVMLIVRRTGAGIAFGIVAILIGLSTLLYFPISGKADFAPPTYFALYWPAQAMVLISAIILLASRDDIEPAWTGYLGLAAAVVALILIPLVPAMDQGNFTDIRGIGTAIVVLVLLVPLIAILRGPPTVAPTTQVRGTTAAPTRTVRK